MQGNNGLVYKFQCRKGETPACLLFNKKVYMGSVGLGDSLIFIKPRRCRSILCRGLQWRGFVSQQGEHRGHDRKRQREMRRQKGSQGLRVGERGDGQRDLKVGQGLRINRGVRSGRISCSPGSKQSRGYRVVSYPCWLRPLGVSPEASRLANCDFFFQLSKQTPAGKLWWCL